MVQGMVDLVGSGGSNVEVAQDVSSSQERITTVPVPDIFRSIPAACEAILENNLRGAHFTPSYFAPGRRTMCTSFLNFAVVLECHLAMPFMDVRHPRLIETRELEDRDCSDACK